MKTSFKLFNASLLALYSLTLIACGGSQDTASSDSRLHPKLLKAKVQTSSLYSPTGDIKDVTPTFKWKAVKGALNYQFGHEDYVEEARWTDYTVSASEAGCVTGSICSYTPDDVTLAVGDEKAWWVQAETKLGWQDWSKGYLFRVISGGPQPLSSQPISPSGVIKTLTPIFTWTPGNGASMYDLGMESEDASNWVSYEISANQANCQPTQCSYKPSDMQNDGDVKTWWVREKRNGNWENWSNGSDFTVKISGTYIPFNGMTNVTSIVEVSGAWYGVDATKTKILKDNGAQLITTFYTSSQEIGSELNTSIMNKLVFVDIKSRVPRTKELHIIDTTTQQDTILKSGNDISIKVGDTKDFLIVSSYERPGRYTPRDFWKIDSGSMLIELGYTSNGSNRFKTRFIIDSVDLNSNQVMIKKVTTRSPAGSPSTVETTLHKVTDSVGVGLEDR